MPAPKRTQKQIAQKYKGNLDYLRQFHGFRTLRWLLFLLVVVLSIGAALGYRQFGGKEFFSTGPLTLNHQRFADRCEVCHGDADPDLFKALRLNQALSKDQQAKAAGLGDPHGRVDLESPQELLTSTGTLSRYDAACIKCHEPFQLHQPQFAALGLKSVYNEIGLVHAGSCSTCHREHQGPGRMRAVASSNCKDCHSDIDRLKEGLALMRSAAKLASPRGETRDLGDGVRRYIPPRPAPHQPVAFVSFAEGHPDFGFEKKDLRDPAVIRYNHVRHAQADITGTNGRKLDCTDCHKLGADGMFMQRVEFEQHCVKCHSLHLDPDAPKITIPHGDPEKVRAYLRSLTSLYVDYGVTDMKITDRAQLEGYVRGQLTKLVARGFSTSAELERRVFYTGDPPVSDRVSARSNQGQFFPGCAKCHEIQPHPGSGAPLITPTNLPDRWLTRGPFTHLPHGHMQCIDCHGAALTSSQTSDILMPSKQSCTECHRPLQHTTNKPVVGHADPIRVNAGLVARQKQEGGILAECQACHPKYHAPADAAVYAKELRK